MPYHAWPLIPCCLPAICRSDHDSDDDQPKKPVPEWARGNQLRAQLVAQVCINLARGVQTLAVKGLLG